MSTYYVAGIPYSDELYHHGIKGQKWGVRRYQNEDGSLTAAGKSRYGNELGERGLGKQGVIRKLATGDWALGNKRIGERLEQRNRRLAKKYEDAGDAKKAKTYERYANIQQKRNVDREIYNSRASTGKLVAQHLLMGEFGADSYRVARQRGESRGKAAVVGILSYIPYGGIAGAGVEFYKSRKNYDK